MYKKIFLSIVVIAFAVIGFGCGNSPATQTPPSKTYTDAKVAAASPTPKHMDEDEFAKFQEISDRLNGPDVALNAQAGESQGWQYVACTAQKNFDDAVALEAATRDPFNTDMAKIISKESAKALVEARLVSFGSAAIKAAKAGKISCEDDYASPDASSMLFTVTDEMNKRNIDLARIGMTGTQMRALALVKAKEELAALHIYEDLKEAEKESAKKAPAVNPDTDAQPAPNPYEILANATSDWTNHWCFTAKDLGLKEEDIDLIQLHGPCGT